MRELVTGGCLSALPWLRVGMAASHVTLHCSRLPVLLDTHSFSTNKLQLYVNVSLVSPVVLIDTENILLYTIFTNCQLYYCH